MTTGTDYMVIWHSFNPKILGYSDSLNGAIQIANAERKKRKLWAISIYKEVKVAL